jgi:mannose-6-phosphate isomerase-like protein (cupin superfamily)
MPARLWLALVIFGGGGTLMWSQGQGQVLTRGQGEVLLGGSRIIKASARTGTQGAEMFWDAMPAGRSTGIHVHDRADEFFYVISGTGSALVAGREETIEAGDVVFVPKGREHRVKNVGPSAPLEVLFLVDRPGLADQFRESSTQSERLKRALTLDERNSISRKYGTTYKTVE